MTVKSQLHPTSAETTGLPLLPFLVKFAQDTSQDPSDRISEHPVAEMGTYFTKVNRETTDDR